MQHATTPAFSKRYLHNLYRWATWIWFLGIAYEVGKELAVTLHRADLVMSMLPFATGVIGYTLFAIPLGAIAALIATCIPLRIYPTTLPIGILRVTLLGLILGALAGAFTVSLITNA